MVNGSGVNVSEYSVAPLPLENDVPVPRFLLIARLLGAKGVREYAQAAAIIKSRHPNVQFDLVGWVDSYAEFSLPQVDSIITFIKISSKFHQFSSKFCQIAFQKFESVLSKTRLKFGA